MRKRLNGVRLAALTAGCTALMVAAAGNAVAKTAMKASGSVTLKLVVADYGTGPANTSKKYWQGIANAFEKQSPSIKVAITDIPWTNFDGCGSAGGTSCRGGWGGNNCAGVAGFV